jgi:hypothetical protein
VSALFDDTSRTRADLPAGTPWVQAHFATAQPHVTFYTLTSGTGADPTAWTLQGSNDGVSWTDLDSRSAAFRWRSQTRAFKVAHPGDYTFYRLELTTPAAAGLAEIELLATP